MRPCLAGTLLAVLLLSLPGEGAEQALTFEDGAKEKGRKRVTTADRVPVYRWTFDLEEGAVFRNVIDNSQSAIAGYGTGVTRVSGRSLTNDDTPAMWALRFNGSDGYVNSGPTPHWNAPVHRTLAFYLKRAGGDQPDATLLHQEGRDGPAVHVALGPKGDGTDLSVRLGAAAWEGTLVAPIIAEAWTHVIITHGYPGIKVYVDTVEQSGEASKGEPAGGEADLFVGGAPGQTGFKGAIDDVRLFNLTHQGVYFIMPRYRIQLPQPDRARRTGPEWYRGKALALRITWNSYLYGAEWKKKDAGKFFDGEEIARMAVDSGACGVLMKMRAPSGFPAYPSDLNPRDFRPERDYAGELVNALREKDLWFAPNLSKSNIDAMAGRNGMAKEDSYYALVKEIVDRYEIKFYQFRFDGFWGQNETYDPADYNHQRVFELFRKECPETLININRFSGHGAEDMADIETSRPTDQLHYWDQEDFGGLLECREWDWAVEVETPMGNDWGSKGDLTALPAKHLLNKISALSAMGITTVIGFGPDVTGRFNDRHHVVLREIGKWLVPRRPYLDGARPLRDIVVVAYPGLWYANRVEPGVAISLLSGSRTPVKLPDKITVKNVGSVGKARLAPQMTSLEFRRVDESAIEISLEGVEQDAFNTIILLTRN